MSVRKGCVVVELNIVDIKSCDEASGIISKADLQDWLNVMQLQDTINFNSASDNTVYIKVFNVIFNLYMLPVLVK